jgi:hypothetical protein
MVIESDLTGKHEDMKKAGGILDGINKINRIGTQSERKHLFIHFPKIILIILILSKNVPPHAFMSSC